MERFFDKTCKKCVISVFFKLIGRVIQVDHVKEYRPPTYKESVPEDIRRIWEEGCAPKPINIPEGEIFTLKKRRNFIFR